MAGSGATSGGPGQEFPRRSSTRAREESQPGHHAVKFYASGADLARAAAPFLAAGLASGAPAALIARRGSADAILQRLEPSRTDVRAELFEQGLLLIDLAEALEQTSRSGRFDDDRGERFLDRLAERLASTELSGHPRIYSELASELCRIGQESEAARLERLWRRRLSRAAAGVMCGYSIDDFSRDASPRSYFEICGPHTRIEHDWDVPAALRETKGELRQLREKAGSVGG